MPAIISPVSGTAKARVAKFRTQVEYNYQVLALGWQTTP